MIRHPVLRNLAVRLAISVALVWTLFPFAWALLTTLKTGTNVYNNQWLPWLQFDPTIDSWRSVYHLPVLREAFLTSAVVSIGVATLTVLLAAPASYGIARMKWSVRWQKGMLFAFLAQRILPPVTFITPYILLSSFLHLKDTIQGLIIVDVTFVLPFAVIVIHAAFASVPPELIEAAQLDGASVTRTFLQVAAPLARPALIAAWILCLAFTWNEWLYADFLTFKDVETMPVALIAVLGGGANVPSATARALSMMAVPIAAALATQRFIASGLSMGAVKG